MRAFISTVIALAMVCSMAACTSRKQESSSSSSVAPSSSDIVSSSSSSQPSSSQDLMDDLESGASNIASGVESGASRIASDVESAVTPTMGTDFEKIGALGTEMVPWGAGVIVDDQNRTVEPQMNQEKFEKYSTYFIGPKDCGKLYLTFDEGYENGYTPVILDVLKEKGVSAVFFVTLPFVKEQPELVQRMIDEGHVVGNHTNRHLDPTELTLDEAYQDIKELHDYMVEHFHYEMFLYRPPEGHFSEQVLAMVQQTGYTTVLWSFGYQDWKKDQQPAYEDALARTTKFIHEGGIYLLHAVSKTNAEILPQLIDEIRARGLELAKWDLPAVTPQA